MNHKSDIIFQRRSIRKYKQGPAVDNKTIDFLLDAAMSAPTARDKQPWQFVVINSKDLLITLSEAHPYGKMLAEAALAVLVCGDSRLDEMESYLVQACSAATQNLLLAAHSIGLGAVWLGIHPRKERTDDIRKLLNIPNEVIPVSLISIGYPNEEKPRNQNFKQERVHYNKWNDGPMFA
jgi:nitroreductase